MLRTETSCVLLAGAVPFILRQEDDYFQLIGACYIHGMMEGEAMQIEDIEIRGIHIK